MGGYCSPIWCYLDRTGSRVRGTWATWLAYRAETRNSNQPLKGDLDNETEKLTVGFHGRGIAGERRSHHDHPLAVEGEGHLRFPASLAMDHLEGEGVQDRADLVA